MRKREREIRKEWDRQRNLLQIYIDKSDLKSRRSLAQNVLSRTPYHRQWTSVLKLPYVSLHLLYFIHIFLFGVAILLFLLLTCVYYPYISDIYLCAFCCIFQCVQYEKQSARCVIVGCRRYRQTHFARTCSLKCVCPTPANVFSLRLATIKPKLPAAKCCQINFPSE